MIKLIYKTKPVSEETKVNSVPSPWREYNEFRRKVKKNPSILKSLKSIDVNKYGI